MTDGGAPDHSLRQLLSLEPSGRMTLVSDELTEPYGSFLMVCWLSTREPSGATERSVLVVVVPSAAGGGNVSTVNGATVGRGVVVSVTPWATAAPVITAITAAPAGTS